MAMKKSSLQNRTFFSILCWSNCCTKWAEYLIITGLVQMFFNVKKRKWQSYCSGLRNNLADCVKTKSLPHVQRNYYFYFLTRNIDRQCWKKLHSLTVHHMQTIQPKYQWVNDKTEKQKLWESKHTLSWHRHSLFLAVKAWKLICCATLSCCQVFL